MHEIKKYLSYDSETGVFIWVVRPKHSRIKIGDIAGCNDGQGYIRINYKKYTFRAHRLAWWWVYGEWPKYDIDHKDTIRHHNQIANLRLDIYLKNQQNTLCIRKDNKSGYKGVFWSPRNKKWIARINANKKLIYLGLFNTPEEAYVAYIEAKKKLHPFWYSVTDSD